MILIVAVLFQTPGPGTYDTADPNITKDKSPHYSMTSRNVMPGDTTRKPGPGAHSPQSVRSTSTSSFIVVLHNTFTTSFIQILNAIHTR